MTTTEEEKLQIKIKKDDDKENRDQKSRGSNSGKRNGASRSSSQARGSQKNTKITSKDKNKAHGDSTRHSKAHHQDKTDHHEPHIKHVDSSNRNNYISLEKEISIIGNSHSSAPSDDPIIETYTSKVTSS